MPNSLHRRRFLWSGLALVGAAAARPARGSRRDEAWIPSDGLLERLPSLMRLASVPGLAIAVVEGGRVTWSRIFGVRDAGSQAPVTKDTRFEAASLSKPAVAYVTLGLWERGDLDLDRPLADIVAPADLVTSPRARAITARHVLSHSSGLPNWRFQSDTPIEPAFDPGTAFRYSGEGFVWLARALEQITGEAFAALMRKRLFDPADLHSATFLWDGDDDPPLALPHQYRGEAAESFHVRQVKRLRDKAREWRKQLQDWRFDDFERAARELEPSRPPLPNFLVPNAAASLLCSADDYARFLTRLMDDPPNREPVLSTAGRRELLSPVVTVNGPLSWGLGVGLERMPQGSLFWHWGDNGGFKTFMAGDAIARRAIVVFSNGAGGHKVYQRIVTDALGVEPAALVWV